MRLDELEAAAREARQAYEAARDGLREARDVAQAAIYRHAEVEARVLGGAGAPSDVTAAKRERDEAIAEFKRLQSELGGGA